MPESFDPLAELLRPCALVRAIAAASRLPRSHPPPGRRIVVIGTSGVGKSTLARRLAQRLDLDRIELDAEHWLPGWTERPVEELRARVEARVRGDRWVVDGNYRSRLRDIVWPRADTIVWLDLGFPRVMAQVAVRTARRILHREHLWGTNRESLRKALSADSILLWSLTTWARQRADYGWQLHDPSAAHATRIQIRSRRELEAWLDQWTAT